MKSSRFVLSYVTFLVGLIAGGAEPVPNPDNWQPGTHYTWLAPANETAVPKGKIEVIEFFLYTNGASRRFHERFVKWVETNPDVHVERVPAMVFPHARLEARMFYTIKELGREADLHPLLYAWMRDDAHFKVYHKSVSHPDIAQIEKMNAEFAKLHGIDETKFLEVYNSKKIEDQTIRSEIEQHSYHIAGTTTVCIGGRYCTSVHRIIAATPGHPDKMLPEDYDRLFKLMDYLVAKERAGMPADEAKGS
jgi:hypothetical protein